METFIAAVVGIGLAASCGFRVFVPLLVASAAAHFGYLELNEGFAWLGTPAALIAFGVAAVMESAAYYVPWLDHLLDAVATPTAAVAGAILFAASAVKLDPFLLWSLAVIAGGGSAAVVQGGTILTRLASTTATGGLGNFVVSTMETVAGFVFSVLSMIVPLLALLLLIIVVGCMYFVGRQIARSLIRRPDIDRK